MRGRIMFEDEIENVLKKMVKQGYVREVEQDGETLYQITPEGEAAMREMQRTLNGTSSEDLN